MYKQNLVKVVEPVKKTTITRLTNGLSLNSQKK